MQYGSMTTCPASGDYVGQDAQYGWDVSHTQTTRWTITTTSDNNRLVLDTASGLMWEGCVKGKSGPGCAQGMIEATSFDEALAYCDALTLGGFTDWHVPDIYELQTIADLGFADSSGIDTAAFPFADNSILWSTTSYKGMTTAYWAANYVSYSFEGANTGVTHVARCVRGGNTVVSPRFARDTSDASHPFVVDHATGLMWHGCPAGKSGATCELGALAPKTWKDALAWCEASDWNSHTDWRLPSRAELLSIVDYRGSHPALDQSVFPGVTLTNEEPYFWTSSSKPTSPFWYVYQVSLEAGWTGAELMTQARSVYCVRDAP